MQCNNIKRFLFLVMLDSCLEYGLYDVDSLKISIELLFTNIPFCLLPFRYIYQPSNYLVLFSKFGVVVRQRFVFSGSGHIIGHG